MEGAVGSAAVATLCAPCMSTRRTLLGSGTATAEDSARLGNRNAAPVPVVKQHLAMAKELKQNLTTSGGANSTGR